MAKKEVSTEIRAVIKETVKETIKAMMQSDGQFPDDAYKQTIHRLEALSVLKDRVEDNKARLEGMKISGEVQGKSKSIVRFSGNGVRADPEEMLEAVEASLEARIAADEEEISEIEDALDYVSGDFYFQTVTGRYIEKLSDEEIAARIGYDESTVRKNRARLVHIIAVKLYGTIAV